MSRSKPSASVSAHPKPQASFIVVPVPAELNSSVITTGEDPGDASEGELAVGGLEEDIGQLDHVGMVVRIARQLDDPPFSGFGIGSGRMPFV